MSLAINKSQSTKILSLKEKYQEINQTLKQKGKDPLTDQEKRQIADQVGDTVVEEIQKHLDRAETPVEGGEYKRTLADGRRLSRLLDEGDMRSQITHQPSASGVAVGIFKDAPEIDRLKASGHNKGDSATGVQRQFIPSPSEEFNDKIKRKINSTINKAKQEIVASKSTRSALDVRDGR
jgi:uncharacterized membrane protein YheB (UPF0754 family)